MFDVSVLVVKYVICDAESKTDLENIHEEMLHCHAFTFLQKEHKNDHLATISQLHIAKNSPNHHFTIKKSQ